MASQPEPVPSVDLNSISLKISIGLRQYRLFDSKFQQACGNIAFLTQHFNRLAAISPFLLKISTGLRQYRLFDSKFQQVCGNIAFLTQNFNRSAEMKGFVCLKFL